MEKIWVEMIIQTGRQSQINNKLFGQIVYTWFLPICTIFGTFILMCR